MGQRENEEHSAVSICHESATYFRSGKDGNHDADFSNDSAASVLNCTESTENANLSDTWQSSDDDFEQNCGHLEPFLHQVGGHGSVLSWDQCTICKPYSSREHRFYEILPAKFKEFIPEYRGIVEIGLIEQNGGLLLLNANYVNVESAEGQVGGSRHAMRKCESAGCLTKRRSVGRIRSKRSGSLELEIFSRKSPRSNLAVFSSSQKPFNDEQTDYGVNQAKNESLATSSESELHVPTPALYPQNPWALHCQTRQITKMHRRIGEKQKFLMLENLVRNFKLPCILDLKMGDRQYGDDASPAKRDSQVKKCRNSTSAILGIRMCGMQVYHAGSGVFKCCNKYYGRSLSVEGFKREIFKFWYNGVRFRADLLPDCIEKLKALKELVSSADGYRFYSSSLLIIYEGDPSFSSGTMTESSRNFPLIDVRMIDFEHTTCPDFICAYGDPPHQAFDRGYVKGVTNLIHILSEMSIDDQRAANDEDA